MVSPTKLQSVPLPFNKQIQILQHKIQLIDNDRQLLERQITKKLDGLKDTSLTEVTALLPNLVKITKNQLNLKNYYNMRGHGNQIQCMKWASDSRHLLSADCDHKMLYWDATIGLKIGILKLNSTEYTISCDISPSSRLIAVGCLDNRCSIFRLPDYESIFNRSINYDNHIKSNEPRQNNIELSTLFTSPSLLTVLAVQDKDGSIQTCEFLDDSSILTTSSKNIHLWDINKSIAVRTYEQNLSEILAVTTNIRDRGIRNGNLFIAGGVNGSIKIYDHRSPSSIAKLSIPLEYNPFNNRNIFNDVTSLKFLPKDNYYAVGTSLKSIYFYDIRVGSVELDKFLINSPANSEFSKINKFNMDISPVSENYGTSYGYNASPSSASIASTTDDDGIMDISFSKSGRLMFTAVDGIGGLVWDTLTGCIINKIDGRECDIRHISVSPDGLAVATDSLKKATVNIWSSSPDYQ
ncbi:WD40 repeat-like protein [Ascoidea rubescens DSM 1968]|uniref:WD40 repeat-like protein n=1 Tax=Ascoidea rubescens DSM 1968 TaxID=1344418 RepID=A0A1D2VKJ5_9ASCO|nr:WD40 repeat-like protein [Ascoidea rubescens DSM 1968]ODV62129.1 WD40 repeat-like protein [Ascoidea rubescens DSM 1968]